MTRLRVLFVTHWFPSESQPVEGIFVREHAKAVEKFVEIQILHLAGEDPEQRSLWRIEREPSRELTDGVLTYRVWHRRPPLPRTNLLLYLISGMAGWMQVRKGGFRPQIVHAHVYKAGLVGLMISKAIRRPLIVSEHSTAFALGTLSRRGLARARSVFRRADLVLPVSSFLQKVLESSNLQARFRVLPNAIDADIFHFDGPYHRGAVIRAVFVGSMVPKKGIVHLIEAAAELIGEGELLELTLVGDGPCLDEYSRLVDQLGIQSNVRFVGRKTKKEISAIFREADFCVVPSLVETFSVVAAEALASGLPLLMTKCGGPEEFVNDQCGVLVDKASSRQLSEGMKKIIGSLAGYDRRFLSTYSRELFAREIVGAQLHDVYTHVISQRSK